MTIDWSQHTLGTRIRYYLLRGTYALSVALNGRDEAERNATEAAHKLGLDTDDNA